MKLMGLFRNGALAGAGLLWSVYASADLPKLAGGSSSNDVMGEVKKMSQDGVAYGALVICDIAFIVGAISCVVLPPCHYIQGMGEAEPITTVTGYVGRRYH